MVLSPTYFQLLLELVWIGFWGGCQRSSCSVSFGNVKFSDLYFTDDAVIFAETPDILLGALDMLNEESEPLGLWVFWVKTKIKVALLAVAVFGEDVEVTERFTYLSSDIHVSVGCETEVSAWGVMDSLDHGVWRCRYLCRTLKGRVFRSLVLPVLLYDVRLGL